jgi:hypothetical protein
MRVFIDLTDDSGHVEVDVAFRIFFDDRNFLFVFVLLLLMMSFRTFRLRRNIGVDRFLKKKLF